jgi:hypothetical protein
MFYEEQLRNVLKFIMESGIIVVCKDKSGYYRDYLFKSHTENEFIVYNIEFNINDIYSVTFKYNNNPIIELKSR